MRIERIKLRNFRGVVAQEVEFNTTGVTVVEGNNEAGKTSVADAFDFLRRYKDTSTHRSIKESKPVNRDVGPFVEATFTVGEHRLTYRKQWLTGKLTELEISGPRPEQLSGDPAHERVEALLREHADMTLFDSLWYHQGDPIAQAEIAGSQSLMSALDAAAENGGEERHEGSQDDLLKRVSKERERYWTVATGREVKDRTTRREELVAVESRVHDLQESLARLEETVTTHTTAQRDLESLREHESEIEDRVGELQSTVAGLEGLRAAVSEAKTTAAEATLALKEAGGDRDARTELSKRAGEAAASLAELQEREQQAAPQLAAAEADVGAATERRASAQVALATAEQELAARRGVIRYLDERAIHAELSARRRRLQEAELQIVEAARAIEGTMVTSGLLRDINTAQDAVNRLRARVEAGQSRVLVAARADLTVSVAGQPRQLAAGDEFVTPVSGELEIDLSEVARIVVSSPEQNGSAELDLQAAQSDLGELLVRAGAASAEAAAELLEERRNAEHSRERAADRRSNALGGLDPARLDAQLEQSARRLLELEAEYGAVAAGIDSDQARTLAESAAARVDALGRELTAAQVGLDTAQSARSTHAESAAERRGRIEILTTESTAKAAALESARAEVTDGQLQQALDTAIAVFEQASNDLAAAERALDDANADATRDELENQLALKQRNADEIVDRLKRIAAAEARLEDEGHSGLSDRLARATAERDARARALDSEDRQAAAVALLYDTLVQKRKAAHAAHARPFLEQLLRYARIVWGPDVEIAIDPETFQVVAMTRDGATVPFTALSGGTREQLAILARLAVAAIVSPSGNGGTPGGVPVIIDDALGYSDPDRLTKLGAAFNVAGHDSQVIVLTCVHDRYRDIGSAKVVTVG